MGNAPYVKVHANADSPSTPGVKSAVSDPLDKYCDYETFFDELLPRLRDPVHPLEQYVLKSLSVVDHGPEEFTVKVTLDGPTLKKLGAGKPDGSDPIRQWRRVSHSREQRMIIFEEYDDEGLPKSTYKLKFLADPFRLEVWGDLSDGQRSADPLLAWSTETFYITPIVRNLLNRKVVVRRDVESPSGNWKTVMSDSLDGYLTFENILEWLPEVMKQMCESAFGTVEEISEHVFETTNKIKIPRAMSEGTGPFAQGQPGAAAGDSASPRDESATAPAPKKTADNTSPCDESETAPAPEKAADESETAPLSGEAAATPAGSFLSRDKWELLKDLTTIVTTKRLVKRFPEEGQFNIVTTHNDQLENTTWLMVHQAPLRMELWCVSNDSRHLAGRVERNLLQDYVNALIKRAEGKEGWFF